MLMGNPNHQEEDEVEAEDGEDKDSENVINREEREMDNVEALMAGVAIEEKDKVRYNVLSRTLTGLISLSSASSATQSCAVRTLRRLAKVQSNIQRLRGQPNRTTRTAIHSN